MIDGLIDSLNAPLEQGYLSYKWVANAGEVWESNWAAKIQHRQIPTCGPKFNIRLHRPIQGTKIVLSICILHCNGTVHGTHATDAVQLSIFDVDDQPYAFLSITDKIPLRTRLRLR